MSNDNNKPSHKLTFDDAVQTWLRVWSGEFQHRIAASFDVNPGRISEVIKERIHAGSQAIAKRLMNPAA